MEIPAVKWPSSRASLDRFGFFLGFLQINWNVLNENRVVIFTYLGICAGWILLGRVFDWQRLRGAWNHPQSQHLQHRTHWAPLCRPKVPQRGQNDFALWRYDRQQLPGKNYQHDETHWNLQLGSAKPRQGIYCTITYTHTILIMNSMSLGFIWLEWVHSWGGRPWNLKAAGCNQDMWAREASEILSSVYVRTLWQGAGNPSKGNYAFLSKITLWLVFFFVSSKVEDC